MAEIYYSSNTNSTTMGENRIASQLPFSPPEPPPRPNTVSLNELLSRLNEDPVSEIDPLTGEEVHRFWDEQAQGHFFTANQSEFSDRQSNPARYRYEGVEFKVPSSTDSQALPVYRFLNELTGNYFYTLQEPDAITGDFPALESEGVAFHAFSPNGAVPAGAVPVYRFFNQLASERSGSPVHFFTASEENKEDVLANEPGFIFEGIGWYALDRDGIATTQGGGSTGGGLTSNLRGAIGSGGTTSPGGGSIGGGGLDDFGLDDSFGDDIGSLFGDDSSEGLVELF